MYKNKQCEFVALKQKRAFVKLASFVSITRYIFPELLAVSESSKQKKKVDQIGHFAYFSGYICKQGHLHGTNNHVHNILRLFDG